MHQVSGITRSVDGGRLPEASRRERPASFTTLLGSIAILLSLAGGATSAEAQDTIPPNVHVVFPNGGEVLEGGTFPFVSWTATDNVLVTAIDVYYREHPTSEWFQIADDISNTGNVLWYIHNTPTTDASFRVVARDAAGNTAEDLSDNVFTILMQPGGVIATTLRDFHFPGTQPFGGGTFQSPNFCKTCHGGYDQAVEPGFNVGGSMMTHSVRDPMFRASLVIAEQDAKSSGDQCLRCHAPMAWYRGRSNPTDGSTLLAIDRHGVSCDFCHRMVDPIYEEGVSPPEDVLILQALPVENRPTNFAEGQAVLDPNATRWRGPFDDPVAPHNFLESQFHSSSDLCGTCHDVSGPLLERTGDFTYELNAMDSPIDSISAETMFPEERTYSEWKASDFNTPTGLYRPEFAGNRVDGMVAECVDCHMKDVEGKGCNLEFAPVRQDLPLHDLTGGNTFIPLMLPTLFPGEVNVNELNAGIARSRELLRNSADLDVEVVAEGDSSRALVTVTNRTGHKLPTGYPEGRRMWLEFEAKNQLGETILLSGVYDTDEAELMDDPYLRVYEIRLGVSSRLAPIIGTIAQESFHVVLSDTVYKDNRIPPEGFANDAYHAFGGKPVDSTVVGDRYADGQYWDVVEYPLPAGVWSATAKLYYQTTSKEHVEFLRDANTTDSQGDDFYDLWVQFGKSAPELMVTDTWYASPTDVGDTGVAQRDRIELTASPNPTGGLVSLRITTPRLLRNLDVEVFDLAGRHVRQVHSGTMAPGAHAVLWDGRDEDGHDTGSGIFWMRVTADGEEPLTQRVVRIR